MAWTIILTPSGPEIVDTPGESNPFADASLPGGYQNEALSSLWDSYQGGSGGGVAVGWADMVRDSVTDLGKQEIQNLGDKIRTRGNPSRDHIPAQNETGRLFGAALDAYNAGLITAEQARAQIIQANNAFQWLTQSIGSARSLRGGAELNDLAGRLLSGLGGPSGGGVVIPPTGGSSPGQIQIAGFNVSTTTLMIGGAIALYLATRND